MKRTVTIVLELDPSNYGEASDSAEGAVDVVIDCLKNEADFSTTLKVSCDDVSKYIELD